MVQNNQKIVFYTVLGHSGTTKWTLKGNQEEEDEAWAVRVSVYTMQGNLFFSTAG
jgi:hypothetical protein